MIQGELQSLRDKVKELELRLIMKEQVISILLDLFKDIAFWNKK